MNADSFQRDGNGNSVAQTQSGAPGAADVHLASSDVALQIALFNVVPTDRSGTVTSGGTAQVLMAANPGRRGFWFQNVSAGDLWINEIGTAAAAKPSFKVPAGSLYENPPNGVPAGAISVFGATTAQAFSAREW